MTFGTAVPTEHHACVSMGDSASVPAEVEVGGFDHVDSTADPSSYVEWMQRQRRTLRDAALGDLQIGDADVVLDLGCGPGADVVRIAEHSRHGVGVDLSVAMVAGSSAAATTSAISNLDKFNLTPA